MLTANIIILNYNGKDLMERFLPSIVREAKRSRYPCAVTVLDNASRDGSTDWVREHYPEVRLIEFSENRLLCAYNEALKRVSEEIVILLNNDMEIQEGFVEPLVRVFEEHPDAFFAASHGDRPRARLHWGILTADFEYPGYFRLIEEPGISFSAGVAAFHRERFLELGGYDELYLPGRYEDIDLCYRGWKYGWKGYYVPRARKNHIGGASFNRAFSPEATQAMVFRNGILFMIKNITDPWMGLKCALGVCLKVFVSLMLGRWPMVQGFLGVFPRLGTALRSRRNVKKHFLRTDREVLSEVNQGIPRQRAVIRWSRSFVEALGRSPSLQRPFFFVGFWSLRLFFPLEFLLLRELINCSSVLDLGCGRHSMIPILPLRIRKVGVELYEPYFAEAMKKGRHHEMVQSDVTEMEFPDKSFDAVALLDVIEHLSREEGFKLMEKMERWARRKIIIFTPNGFLPQDSLDENPLMQHRSGWRVSDFRERGYRTHGVRGLKWLKTKAHAHEHEIRPSFAQRLVDLTQIATYHFPESAYQLFCIKDLEALRANVIADGKATTQSHRDKKDLFSWGLLRRRDAPPRNDRETI